MSDTEISEDGAPIKPTAFRSRPGEDERGKAGTHAWPDNHEPAEGAGHRTASPDQGDRTGARGSHVRARVMWSGLAILIALAAFVFLLLPDAVQMSDTGSTGVVPDVQSPASGSAAAGTQAEDPPELAPWQTAQILRQKETAEAVTEQFVRLQMELEDAGVERWGAERFGQAILLAQDGDGQFSQRDYEAAAASYEKGLGLLRALERDTDAILLGALSTGQQALQAYDAGAAQDAFELALALEPDNPAARKGLARAQHTEEVAQRLLQAKGHEERGELEAARDELVQANKLDPEDQAVATSRKRLDTLLRERQFDALMSRAYADIDGGRIDDAVLAFGKAEKLRPDSAEVREGLAQAESLRRLESIAELQEQAIALEASENWEQAAGLYTRALSLDNSLVFAREGQRRASERAELDKRLRSYIQQPERLQADTVYQAAGQILGIAANVEPRTPILARQISELEKVLLQSRQPVSVLVQSDNLTRVTLARVGPLGTFSEKQLTLRPGTYVITGSRDGYRDVRRTFVVAAGDEQLRVLVSCEERI
jgi:tetratricopeptide (TPR) repeat protein